MPSSIFLEENKNFKKEKEGRGGESWILKTDFKKSNKYIIWGVDPEMSIEYHDGYKRSHNNVDEDLNNTA